MDENHVDEHFEESEENNGIFNIINTIIDKEGDNAKTCITLSKCLENAEVKIGSRNVLRYTLHRLIRGLGSPRHSSQCACFATLTFVLRYHTVPLEDILKILKKEYPETKKNDDRLPKEARVLTYGCLIHSGLYESQTEEVQRDIIKKLISAGKSKDHLSSVGNQFLIDLVKNVDEDHFKNILLPTCESEFNTKELNADTLNFLLVCLKQYPKEIHHYLKKSELPNDFLIKTAITTLVDSKIKHNDEFYDWLGKTLCKDSEKLIKVWTGFTNNSKQQPFHKDNTLVIIFLSILEHLKEVDEVPKLLTPTLISSLLNILSFKTFAEDDNCFERAQKALHLLVKAMGDENVSDNTKLHVIKRLSFYPGSFSFEKKTGTKCMQSVILLLSEDAVLKLAELFKQIITGEVKKRTNSQKGCRRYKPSERQYVLHLYVNLLNHSAVKSNHTWKCEQIKWIFYLAFINNKNLPFVLLRSLKHCFYKSLELKETKLEDLMAILKDVIMFINEKIALIKDFSEVAVDSWSKMLTAVQKIDEKNGDKLLMAIQLFLVHMGLQLFTENILGEEFIDEILQYYNDIEKKEADNDNEKAHWTEVIVDLILSLLSRSSYLYRYIVSKVFPRISPYITSHALHEIIDGLDLQSEYRFLQPAVSINQDGEEIDDKEDKSEDEEEGETENKSESEEDEEDATEPKEENGKDATEPKEENGKDESESDSESGDSLLNEDSESSDLEGDENAKISDEFRAAIQKALSGSGNSDAESVDMDDMDEEEEERLNKQLSLAFKLYVGNDQKKKKKRRQTKGEEGLMNFRIRILDLFEMYILNFPRISGCLDLILPLLELFEIVITDQHQERLMVRIEAVLKKLTALRQFRKEEEVDEKILTDLFKELVLRMKTSAVKFPRLAPRISECMKFLIKCAQVIKLSSESQILLVDDYIELLKDRFQSPDGITRTPVTMFESVLRIFWSGHKKIFTTLYNFLIDSNVKMTKKLVAANLLVMLYRNGRFREGKISKLNQDIHQIELDFIENFKKELVQYRKRPKLVNLKFFSSIITLIHAAYIYYKKTRKGMIETPHWGSVVGELSEIPALILRRKTRLQLKKLAGKFNVELPDKKTMEEKLKEAKEEEAAQEEPKEKKKKKKSSQKVSYQKGLKRKLKEVNAQEMNDDYKWFGFSSVDYESLPGSNKGLKRKCIEENSSSVNGYANEVGEAFRPLVHRYWVYSGYGVATLYVLADTADKTFAADKEEKSMASYNKSKVVNAAVDTLVWQGLASVVIPGYTINRLCALSLYLLKKTTKLPKATRKWTTTGIGLASIPFIVKPIDNLVHFILDRTLRPWLSGGSTT